MRNKHLSVRCIPRWDLMTPPKLSGNTPVLNIFEPLVVSCCPVIREKLDLTFCHNFKGDFGNAFAWVQGVSGGWLAHGNKPLVCEHGLEHFARSVAARLHHFVRINFDQETLRREFSNNCLTRFVTIQTMKLRRTLIVDFCIKRKDHNEWQIVAHCAGIVVKVMRSCDFDAACSKGGIHKIISNDRNLTIT